MTPAPDLRARVLDWDGHALVIGGPGSGKTTVALRKAVQRIKRGMEPGQSVLFLSFSRAAVARILSAAQLESSNEERELLSIQTFHSFFWNILKAHGYLLGAPYKLSILLPHDEKSISGGIDAGDDGWDDWQAEREKLFRQDGKVAFDLFAPSTVQLLESSSYILTSIARRHPLIIVDEAQDTGDIAWRCMELLAKHTQMVCLADLEQQIFDFLPGVGPERILSIRKALDPLEIDLGTENHRSPDSQILEFANDVLAGHGCGGPYKGVSTFSYRPENPPPNWNHLLRRALKELYELMEAKMGALPESVAILVPNNKSALKMSNALNALGAYVGKQVRHKLLFDEAEALLSARLAAFLLEPKVPADIESDIATCMELIAAARSATGHARKEIAKLREQALKIRSGKALSINIVKSLRSLIDSLIHSAFTGDPAQDWLAIKQALRNAGQSELDRVAGQLDFLVAFRRGHRIAAGLASEWLRDGAYTHARRALDLALTQEQILDGSEPTPGVQVMNFHKAKGKQFDCVIIVREARRSDKGIESSFVWRDDSAPYLRSRKILRVGITRARHHVIVINPMWPPCPIIKGLKL
ncbi:UvrD-helicase domain-containing protein [Pseudomonas viridiflava]|jgi:DNA helicase II / ATP-dependent DNA helicase PcrA|uniref:UvrD-helicase domain-containing protein n=1 Tax=Pseudomonas viridiflava TaxID=33069 RepID=UPI000F023231|nr:ATP-dependent helicase [Pseudomonas viridiflava]MDY0938313.1 ATP-dependent helicase [Pseudomonas viridiflava]MDY1015410.1 ATP-dependent helicase [Pseudomonas viridiflava]